VSETKVAVPTAQDVVEHLASIMAQVEHDHNMNWVTGRQVLEYELFACQVEALLVIARLLAVIAEKGA
jgi:hypothetical protein